MNVLKIYLHATGISFSRGFFIYCKVRVYTFRCTLLYKNYLNTVGKRFYALTTSSSLRIFTTLKLEKKLKIGVNNLFTNKFCCA